MERALYAGHCQACGRLHKARRDDRTLALHGYKVKYGFFSGTCPGSRELAFEDSCELVARFVADATAQRYALKRRCDDLMRPATEPKTMISVYQEIGQTGKFEYVWMPATVHGEDECGYIDYTWKLSREVVRRRGCAPTDVVDEHSTGERGAQPYEFRGETLDALVLRTATRMNISYVTRYLSPQVVQLDRYIAWQGERVKTWTKQPLLPVSHVDDGANAFNPEAA